MKKPVQVSSLSFLLTFFLFPLGLSAQPSWQLLGNTDLYLGQYFFNHSAGSLGWLGDVDLQLAHSLSPESGFFISADSNYSGVKSVNELAGGGTLFQHTWDNALGFKWIKRYDGGFSVKPRVGFKSELFQETSDEQLGKGLYDSIRYEAGIALERKTRWNISTPWTYQFSYDFYYTHYPHFTSLASQFGSALASPNPGAHVLDTVTNQFTYRSDFDLPGFANLWGMYSLALVSFTDSKVVNDQDQYLSSQRSDAYQTLSVGYSKRLSDIDRLGRIRPIAGLSVTLNDQNSNQNNFDTDPARLKYIGGYFNYWEARLSPTVETVFLKTLIDVRIAYDFAYRAYTGRLTQNADGSYAGDKLQQYTNSVIIEAGYPIPWVRGLSLKARGVYSAWSSNTHFQQTYVYDYTSYNYFAGVEWKL